MSATKKLYERIYITGFEPPLVEGNGEVVLMAIDDVSKFLHPPVIKQEFEKLENHMDAFVTLFNGINKDYNRNIHAGATTYITDLPNGYHPLIKSMITPKDSIVFDPEATQKEFQPVIDQLFNSFNS